jgi:ParB-like chromosome segregation protein Spo0J
MTVVNENLPPYKVIPTEKLVPYARNSRTHSPEQVDQIAASIREFGFTNPLLIDSANTVIAGHGRLLAAHKLGLVEVPTIELDSLSDAQKRAYIIADNKLALNAGWDDDMLKIEFEDLADFDLVLTGFSLDEIDDILIPLDYSDKNMELDVDGFDDAIELKLRFSSDDYELVKTKLYEYGDRPETALMAVLGL